MPRFWNKRGDETKGRLGCNKSGDGAHEKTCSGSKEGPLGHQKEEELSNYEALGYSEMADRELIKDEIENLSDADRLVLSILFTGNKAKVTRLQKIGLLVNAIMEGRVPSSHDSYFFGGFSEDIEDSITKLSDNSMLNPTTDGFVLTPYGKLVFSQMKAMKDSAEDRRLDVVEEVVNALSRLSDKDVLDVTYYLFPELTENSLIKKQVERRLKERGIRGVKAYRFKKEELSGFINKIQSEQ